jgi:hypothetical protein
VSSLFRLLGDFNRGADNRTDLTQFRNHFGVILP